MNYTVKENTAVKHVVEFEIPANEFDMCYDKVMKNAVEELEVPGFRKGKAPFNVAEKYLNKERIISDTVEFIVAKTWNDYLKETKIDAISQPELQIIKVAKGNDFIFSASVEILSDIKLPDVKKISKEIKKNEIVVEPKEIEDAITWLRNSKANLNDKEGAASLGDYAEIEFTFEDIPSNFSHIKGVQRDAFILGRNNAIEGLDDGIAGMLKGEEKLIEGKINQKIDKLQPEKMPVKMNVKLINIQELDVPELTDEWVKSLGMVETVEDLKKELKNGLTEDKAKAEKDRVRVEAIDKIIEKTEFEIPQILITREEENLMENLKEKVKHEMNIELSQYFQQINKTKEEVEEDFKKVAQERIKRFLILHQISKNENIIASDEEIKARLDELLMQYPEEEKSKIDINRASYIISDEIVREKIFSFLEL